MGKAMADVEPIPVRRLHVNVLIVALAGIGFYIAGFVAGIPTIPGSNGNPRFDWMAQVGASFSNLGTSAMLQFPGWAFALLGLTAGGQVVLQNKSARLSLRRVLGLLGSILALAALTITVFMVAACLTTVERVPNLFVVLPAAALTWGVAVECARFIVPDFSVQLDGAQSQLDSVVERQRRVPPATATTVGAYLTLVGAGLIVGLATAALLVRTSAFLAVLGFGVTALSIVIGLYLYAQLTSPALVQPSRPRRFWVRTGGSLMYAALVLLSSLNLVVAAPSAWVGLGCMFILELLLPLAFLRLPDGSPQGLINISLGGALARFLRDDLDRAEISARNRLVELEAHAANGGQASFAKRLTNAITAFRQ